MGGDSLTQSPGLRTEKQLRGFARFLRLVSAHVWDDKTFGRTRRAKFLCELIDVGTALVEGVIIDMEIEGASVAELDALDFRDWLCGAGAHREAVFGSSIVQSLYNTTFQYLEGDKRRPSLGAGSAAQVSLRLFGGYKDAFLYESTAGLGEVVVAPIYGALRKWGVKFQFFHKLTCVELNDARDGVSRKSISTVRSIYPSKPTSRRQAGTPVRQSGMLAGCAAVGARSRTASRSRGSISNRTGATRRPTTSSSARAPISTRSCSPFPSAHSSRRRTRRDPAPS